MTTQPTNGFPPEVPVLGPLIARLPDGWTMRFVERSEDGVGECIDWDRKAVELAACPDADPARQIAHAVAHVLRHCRGYSSRFTPAEEDEAEFLAACWLAWSTPDVPVA